MGKKKPKKNGSPKQVAQLALATAILTLIHSIITLIRILIEWLAPT